MIYNVDFLIAGLIFTLIILYHFVQQQGLHLLDNRSFLWLVVLGILNIVVNITAAVLITWGGTERRTSTDFLLTLLYCLHILVPSAVVNHVFYQFPPKVGNPRLRFVISYIVPGIMLALVISNRWNNLFFTVSKAGRYSLGPLYNLMYIFGGSYLVIAALTCLVHKKHLSHFKRCAIWEGILISGATVMIQSKYQNVLFTGFGISLGIAVLFFTLNNPFHYTDSLTSTFDVRYFRDRVQNYMERRKNFHVIFVELSQLKQLNRVVGTDVVNRLLTKTGLMLRDTDKQNLVFRISGRRFALITTSLVLYEDARTKILHFFGDSVKVGDRTIELPVTVCGMLDAQELNDIDSLLDYADYLLSLISSPMISPYLIQNSDETLKGFRHNKLVEQYLQTAVREDLLDLNYQPIYSVAEKKFVSVEALSRMRHPALGPISPEIFIPMAEKNDLIADLSILQLRRACRFVKENPIIMETMDSMKFNLSPAELMHPGHVDQLIRTIREADLPTEFFQFEITETVATEYSSLLTLISSKFADAGIQLCLDDFGSGYANLNTVFRLPFTTIKLDRTLLQDICHNFRAASLYQGLTAAIHSMDAHIVAEGVETPEELEKVSDCGVDQIQGFYFSRPLPPQKLLELLQKQKADN